MRDVYAKRRYKVRDRRSDGKFFYDTSWADGVQLAPDWFKTKAEAAEAWLKAQNGAEKPKGEPGDYKNWKMPQIREEYTNRTGEKLPVGTKKSAAIELLKALDKPDGVDGGTPGPDGPEVQTGIVDA